MGCDYYADDGGTFILRVRSRASGESKVLRLNDLEPNEQIDRELVTGRFR